MRLARMGSSHPHRLSFLRILLRRAGAERWRFSTPIWDINAGGVGHAVLCAQTPERTYSLVAFAHDLPDAARSDRVIATAWDATFALFDGVPDAEDIARLAANVPLQEAGRVSERELTLSRANRSVRLWEHVVEALAAGRQPDAARIDEVGYLMRTTAVYGSGKFGAQDRAAIAARPECAAPFQVEMLTVYLIRAFVADLVEHMARARSPGAVPLERSLRQRLGIGNSTGLGMAPFVINHPALIDRWVTARETALARVRALEGFSATDQAAFGALVTRAAGAVDRWQSAHPVQVEKISALKQDIAALQGFLGAGPIVSWDAIAAWAEEHLSLEGQEWTVALLLELQGPLVDDLADSMACDEDAPVDGGQALGALARELAETYAFCETADWDDPPETARIWYTSQEKLEPRLGERHEEPLGAYEQPLQPARDAARLVAALTAAGTPDATVAEFLARHPEHRHTVRRAQLAARHDYAEVRDNTIHAQMLPIDLLRFKLAFFGARAFDPRSDRWVRITLFDGAPYPGDLTPETADRWLN
ncbi:MAG: hypothetical protein AAF631_00555 [Pseudomonadota bacterium]